MIHFLTVDKNSFKKNFKASVVSMSFHRVTETRTIRIAPYYLGDILSGIERELNNKVMSYIQRLNGIITAYENINIVSSVSTIIDDIPFILIEIEVDFIVLKFIKDEIINGIITKCGQQRIDLLVYNTFNAQIEIADNQIKQFGMKCFKIGTKISFQCDRYQPIHKNKMGQILGRLAKSKKCGYFDDDQNFISIIDMLPTK